MPLMVLSLTFFTAKQCGNQVGATQDAKFWEVVSDEHVNHEVSNAVDKGKGKEKEQVREVGEGEDEGVMVASYLPHLILSARLSYLISAPILSLTLSIAVA